MLYENLHVLRKNAGKKWEGGRLMKWEVIEKIDWFNEENVKSIKKNNTLL